VKGPPSAVAANTVTTADAGGRSTSRWYRLAKAAFVRNRRAPTRQRLQGRVMLGIGHGHESDERALAQRTSVYFAFDEPKDIVDRKHLGEPGDVVLANQPIIAGLEVFNEQRQRRASRRAAPARRAA